MASEIEALTECRALVGDGRTVSSRACSRPPGQERDTHLGGRADLAALSHLPQKHTLVHAG